MTMTDRPVDNGVNVEALLGAREALTGAPEAAQFTWRASCTWRTGTHSHSTVTSFTGLGTEQQHRTTYEFDADHPECFASADNGATPVEYVLVGLVGCLTAGVASVAQLRGIQLRSVTAAIEGQMDILGILGADPDVRNGFDDDHGPVHHRRRRLPRGPRGAAGPVPEALGSLRHRGQPDEGPRRARLTRSARTSPR